MTAPAGSPSREAQARAVRALAGAQRVARGLGRFALWATILLFAFLYAILAALAYIVFDSALTYESEVMRAGPLGAWSVIAMNALPLWASLLVLISCATAFSAERAAGTLDGLRLAGMPGFSLARALMRPRLRMGLIVLLVGLPFYLLPRDLPHVSEEWIEPSLVAQTGLISTFGRGYLLLRIPDYGWAARNWLFFSFYSGLPAFIVDAARLYAAAAIGTAVSLRARTAARAVFWSLAWALAFLAATVGAEWLGVLAVLPLGHNRIGLACLILVAGALVLEAGVGNLLVPRLILRAAARRAEGWFSEAG